MNKLEQEKLQYMSNAIRGLSIDAVERANSGHPGIDRKSTRLNSSH